MLGKPYMVPIGREGISVEGLLYTDPYLGRLQKIHGPGHKYHVSVDPFDMGQIWLFPPGEHSPKVIPSRRPHLCVGYSLYQTKVNRRMARKLYGTKATPEQVAEVIAKAERLADERLEDGSRKGGAAAAARFRLPNGEFLTPVVGDVGVVAHLPPAARETEIFASTKSPPPPTPKIGSSDVPRPAANGIVDMQEKLERRLREKAAKREKAS